MHKTPKHSDPHQELQPKSFAIVLIVERPEGVTAEQMALLATQQISVGLGLLPQIRAHIMAPSERTPNALHFDVTAALERTGSTILS